jgi:transposase
MNLGFLTLAKSEWKKLAYALESKLIGQVSLLENEPEIERIAQKAIDHGRLVQNVEEYKADIKQKQAIVNIDLNSLKIKKNRSLGPELAGNKAWQMLDFDRIFIGCGFDKKQLSLAKTVIMGRLIAPGSDLSTYSWFQKRSSLNELLESDLSDTGKDMFYEIADEILECKGKIEQELYEKEKDLFPRADSIILYDLTNTYFEGSCLNNNLAAYGKCKSKRTDCPLVTLALVVDSMGFPLFSQIYKGNQSEPETFEGVLQKLQKNLFGNQMGMILPTIVMDRGIATEDNVKLLNDNKFPYIVIERKETELTYQNEFVNAKETFERIDSQRKSVYGDENNVYIKKINHSENICRVLCLSEGKEKKERSIDEKKEKYFIEDLKKLNQSIEKNTIKKPEKISQRLGRIKERHSRVSKYYDLIIEKDIEEKIKNIRWDKINIFYEKEKLYGCYVIETTHRELDAKHIWKLYMTLTRVESAFRALKSELGFRPVFHHGSDRTEGHLFISVLAYHLLNYIEKTLSKSYDNRMWKTIRDILSTHKRSTIVMTNEDGSNHHYTVSSEVEYEQQLIYDRLNVNDPLKVKHEMAKFNL